MFLPTVITCHRYEYYTVIIYDTTTTTILTTTIILLPLYCDYCCCGWNCNKYYCCWAGRYGIDIYFAPHKTHKSAYIHSSSFDPGMVRRWSTSTSSSTGDICNNNNNNTRDHMGWVAHSHTCLTCSHNIYDAIPAAPCVQRHVSFSLIGPRFNTVGTSDPATSSPHCLQASSMACLHWESCEYYSYYHTVLLCYYTIILQYSKCCLYGLIMACVVRHFRLLIILVFYFYVFFCFVVCMFFWFSRRHKTASSICLIAWSYQIVVFIVSRRQPTTCYCQPYIYIYICRMRYRKGHQSIRARSLWTDCSPAIVINCV